MEVKRIMYRGEEIVLPRPIVIPDNHENEEFAVFKAIIEEWKKDIVSFKEEHK